MELSRRLFLACNGHVFSAKGIVYNPYYNCTVLETVEEWGNDVNNSTEYTRITKQPLYSLSGVTISLLSIGAVYNYAHFLFDSIARLVLLDKVPVVADRILISGPKTAWKEKIISHLRLSEKVVWVEAEDELQCEQLVFTNRINYSRHISPFAISAIRKLFLLGTDSGVLPRPHRILFASRTNAKDRQHKFENLIQELLPSIVEIVDFEQLSMEETIKRCSECKCFIGVHGAAFSNLVFCNPHTKVAEFQIESVLPEWHRNYYQTLRGPLNFSYEVHLLNDTQQSTDIKIIIDTIIAQAMDAPSS